MEKGEGEYAQDGSVDLRGNPVLRSKRGGWTACSFIVVYELFERMAYYGIASNLVMYMTKNLHQGIVEASNNVTNWSGTVFLTPLIGAVVADAYLGRYWTFVAGSAIYLMGMILLTLSVSVPALKPPPCDVGSSSCPPTSALQLGVYLGGLYTIALGHGGTKPNISTMGADQFDESDPSEKLQKLSFFNWWMFTIFLGILFSTTVLVYLQDNVSWAVGYGVPTLGLLASVLVFLAGTPLYRHKMPQRAGPSPLTSMGRVVAAAVWKRKWKANDKEVPAWTVCTAAQVEETKQMARLVPLLVTMFLPCMLLAQAGTLFVKQGATLDRRLGGKFLVPPASLGVFVVLTMLLCVALYDRVLVPLARRRTGNPRGVTLLQRIGAGLLLQTATMALTAAVETRRLAFARTHAAPDAATGGMLPLSIFVLLPQFVLMGASDALLVVGQIEFFYDQAPHSMKSLGTALSLTAYGVGNILSGAVLSLVERVTGGRGRGGTPWVVDDLNASRLDYYYALLTVLAAVNLAVFLALSGRYTYRAESTGVVAVVEDVHVQGGPARVHAKPAAPVAMAS